MAQYTDCQTPGAYYRIAMRPAEEEETSEYDKVKTVEVTVTLPRKLILHEDERELIKTNIHNVMELALKELFDGRRRR
jgi:hypothetical protein